MKIEALTLENSFVRLEPYAEAHEGEVRQALDLDEASWDLMATSAFGAAFDGWWAFWMDQQRLGRAVCFAVRAKETGRVVGTTSLFEIHPAHRRVEVGATFYRPDARSGPVNPACKRLMLEHAFAAGAVRVEILTDALNLRSRAAILRLGAQAEGLLRSHKITHTGRVRDTAIFSITDGDWPDVRDRLDDRLAGFEPA